MKSIAMRFTINSAAEMRLIDEEARKSDKEIATQQQNHRERREPGPL
jgi:hypothetical protein